jgi:hypothetical protein
MWISCLVMLVVMAGLSWLEWQWVAARNLPLPWLIGSVMGISVAFALSALEGSIRASLRLRSAGNARDSWKDGEVISISGRVQSRTGPVETPIHQRSAVAYSYTWTAWPRGADSEAPGQSVAGLHMGEVELLTPQGSIRLEGFPSLEHFPSLVLEGKSGYRAAARWLAARAWETQGITFKTQQRPQLVNLLLHGVAPQHLPIDIMHGALRDGLFRQGKTAAAIEDRLDDWQWEFEERFIPSGSEITVKGRYSANPPTIQVQAALLNFESEVKPGQAAANAGKEMRTYALSALFNGILAAAFHFDIYWNEAAIYRRFLRFLGSLELEE